MSHPATSNRGITFVRNAGQPTEQVITRTSVPLERRRMMASTASKPEEIARVFNGAMEDLFTATIGSRSIPFGGPIVILQGIKFTAGTKLSLAHRLKSAKTILLGLAQPRLFSIGSGSPCVFVPNDSNGELLVDDTTIWLYPLGTFTADVVLGLGP